MFCHRGKSGGLDIVDRISIPRPEPFRVKFPRIQVAFPPVTIEAGGNQIVRLISSPSTERYEVVRFPGAYPTKAAPVADTESF